VRASSTAASTAGSSWSFRWRAACAKSARAMSSLVTAARSAALSTPPLLTARSSARWN
jgi:hypothetical protein